MHHRKKLIEVALPLDAINKASAREKSIRQGHPSTLHLWWARRPLAAACAMIFAQLVDDPSGLPDLFPTEKKQEKERQRLFRIIEDLVPWANTANEAVLQAARDEIWQSWRRACAENVGHPRAKELFDRRKLPSFYDPFAGGGALPLEAQRLGLESYASDLNPIAVLITKAIIEIPPKFAGRPSVNPQSRTKKSLDPRQWHGAQGLADDVQYYGQWMRDEAEKRIGNLYPKIEVTPEMTKGRPDLRPYVGKKLTVIAWIWARTVKSPNPAFAKVDVPLVSTFMLSAKAGKEVYVEPIIEDGGYRFNIRMGKPKNAEAVHKGTKSGGSHSSFLCLMSGAPMPFEYLRTESKAGRTAVRLMAIVAEGERKRVYLSPTQEMESIARKAKPEWKPDVEICHWPGRTNVVEYGMTRFSDLFTPRQLVALTTFSDLVIEAHDRVKHDALKAGLPNDEISLDANGTAATAYADAVAIYLGLGVSRSSSMWSSNCWWQPNGEFIAQVFTRQAIPMVWDFGEVNPFSDATGNWSSALDWITQVMANLPARPTGISRQHDAGSPTIFANDVIISTDPPYYDNIEYADLSDFYYVWQRRALKPILPDLFATLAVPKSEELVANPYRHGGKKLAELFFLNGMTRAMQRLAEQAHPAFPVTIYYAFKQSETESDGTASTGWETFLEAVIQAGFALTGTWPVRTERPGGVKANFNALASSIVLVCRKRATDAPTATRGEFVNALKAELSAALAHLQHGNIAPVDLAQAAIGPGMAVFTRYAKVLNAEGKPLRVRDALALINQTLDEALAEQEGDFDSDSRWALAWFEQSGFADGEYGVAEMLSKAKNTSVSGMVDAGIVASGHGKVRLLKPNELAADWNPTTDPRLTAWEMVHQLIRSLEASGEGAAATLVAKLGSKAEIARELAYRLYALCERKKRAVEALSYNGLVQSWPEILRLAQEDRISQPAQAQLI